MKDTNQQKRNTDQVPSLSGYMGFIILFWAIVLLFWLGEGRQLYYRDSNSSLSYLNGDRVTEDLTAEFSVQYVFHSDMEIPRVLRLKFATWNRPDLGTLNVKLTDMDKNIILFQTQMEAGDLGDSEVVEFLIPEYNQGSLYGDELRLELSSLDGVRGESIAPWIVSSEKNGQLYYNGSEVDGTLCMELSGENIVWLGRIYWKVAGAAFGMILVLLGAEYTRQKRGRSSFFMAGHQIKKDYGFLMKQLVLRDFKTKYKKSVLGVLWSFISPLMMMAIQYIVFSKIFTNDIECYPVYLLSGYTIFNFFSESVNQGIESIVSNASLITKVYMPKYIYPFTRVCSSAINLLITMILLLVMCVVMGIPFKRALILIPFPILCIFVFTLGVTLLLTSLMVFFRDVKFLWGALSLAWMYATPIFYPTSIISERFSFILYLNPITCILQLFRTILIDGRGGEPKLFVLCACYSLGSLIIGSMVFKKTQDKFILYI